MTLDRFIDEVVASGLMTRAAVTAVRDRLNREQRTMQGLADALIKRKFLTIWEARQIAAKRGRFLLLEGRYRLKSKLGEGGMGAVFRALDIQLDRRVALKIPRTDRLENPSTLKRFRREALAHGRLEHPGIVRALDVGSDGPIHFIVFEWVEGLDLRRLVGKNGPLSAPVAADYMLRSAEAMAFAHARGVTHRDVKPGNIMITPDDRLKVLDLGFARLTAPQQVDPEERPSEYAQLTKVGSLVGTVDYMAPEQARDTRQADVRSDIYGMGCTFYFALTGRPPYPAKNSIDALFRHAKDPIPRVPGGDPTLDAILRRMMAKKPADRYQSFEDVIRALEAWLNSPAEARHLAVIDDPGIAKLEETIEVAPRRDSGNDSPEQDIPTWLATLDDPTKSPAPLSRGDSSIDERSRPWGHLVSTVIAATLLLVGGSILWNKAGQTQIDVQWPEDQRTGGTIIVDGKTRLLPTVGSLVYPGSWGERQVAMSRPGYLPLTFTVDLARGERRVLNPRWAPTAATRRRQEITQLEEAVADIATRNADDPDVARLRRSLFDFQARWRQTKESLRAATLLSRLPSPHDGRSFVSDSGFGPPLVDDLPIVAVWAQAGSTEWTYRHEAKLSRDGELLIVPTPKKGLSVLHLRENQETRDLAVPAFSGRLDVDEATQRVATLENQRTVRVRDLTTGEILWSQESEHDLSDVSFCPGGSHLAVSGFPKPESVAILDASTGQVRLTLQGSRQTVRAIAYSPQGSLLASVCQNDTGEPAEIKIWDVTQGVEWMTIRESRSTPTAVAFSPDGHFVATGAEDGAISLWDTESGESIEDYRGHEGAITTLCFRPDGKQFASGSEDGTVRLWQTESRQPEATFQIGPRNGRVNSVIYSPEGRHLVTANGDGTVYMLRLEGSASYRPRKMPATPTFDITSERGPGRY
ncbi:Serine/threonine-protein kinase StkP [Planctomycetes bacterium Pan216]|uniref:Serine/threonine-protein kinase StkP n=1 Tax=Kolteria novifilia TaxID=2527975 RepID=A0A518BBP6_9BACT|nr:Serine/threonine-protein kinase StkP [Planctomycetes bacterium Pan216]